MKNLDFYKNILNLNSQDDIFDYIVLNLKPSNISWSYFVNWEKVFDRTSGIELQLNILNYLIGKDNFDEEFKTLLRKQPQIIDVLPYLVVRRDKTHNKTIHILVDYSQKKLVYKDYDFTKTNVSDEDIESYLEFVSKTGFKNLIAKRKIKNLVDYMIGVEAGLDSNGRKNRGGLIMQDIIEIFVKDICEKRNYKYLKEADAKKIENEIGYTVPVDKSSRRYDFVIDNGRELFIIETNFYGGGGSKLKSTAGEYRNLFDTLSGKYKFIWITDGLGWQKTKRPLRETFDHNDYVFSLSMIENNILEYILNNNEQY